MNNHWAQLSAMYKYNHQGARFRSARRKTFMGICGLISLTMLCVWLFSGSHFSRIVVWVALPLIFAFIGYASAPRMLFLRGRYLICGKDIIYFSNVCRLKRFATMGLLQIDTDQNKTLIIKRENFPTNARKNHKIQLNKQKKFDKVSEKIIQQVALLRPDAQVIHHG